MNNRLVSAVMMASCIVHVGCKTAELSAGGKMVQTGPGSPADHGFDIKSCEPRGVVVGSGGGAFGGAYVSNESLIEHAMNDMRNKAAELGANYVQHSSPTLGETGGKNSSATTTATVNGTAYLCRYYAR